MRNDFYCGYYEDSCLAHSGVMNMRWGVRRYQNYDGSLTELGRQHYGVGAKRVKRANDVANRYRVKSLKANIKQTKLQTKDLKKYGEVSGKTNDRVNRLKDKEAKSDAKYHKKLAVAEAKKYRLQEDMRDVNDVAKLTINSGLVGKGEAKIQRLLAKQSIAEREKQKAEDLAPIAKSLHDETMKQKRPMTQAQAFDNAIESGISEYRTSSISKGFGNVPKNLERFYQDERVDNISFSKQSVGRDKFTFEVDNNPWPKNKDKALTNAEATVKANEFLKKLNIDDLREELAKEYYDTDDRASGWKISDQVSREKFKKEIKPYNITIHPSDGTFEISFDDGDEMYVGGHSLDMEGDIETLKIKYHSMNG